MSFALRTASSRSATTCTHELLGREVPTSIGIASPTGLVDLRTRTWDEELLDTLGLDAERLPEISDAPVDGWYPALLDGACSNFGAGCVTRGRAALMVGTSGAIRVVYETDRPQPRPALFLHWVDETRVVEGGSLSDGGNLHYWLDQTLKDARGSLAGRDPDSHGLTFLSLLGGERSPGWHQHAQGAVHGLTFDTTALDLRQAGLEGVAFRFAEVADLMPGSRRSSSRAARCSGIRTGCRSWPTRSGGRSRRPASRRRRCGVRPSSCSSAWARRRLLHRCGAVVEPRADKVDVFRAARERQRRLYEVVTSEPTS